MALSVVAGCYLSHPRPLGPDGGADAGPPPRCTFAPERAAFVTSTPFAAHAPELGWDGERLGLVVFESDGDIGHPVVSFTRVPADLAAPPLAVVGEESHSWGEAAWDERVGFAVCWNGDPGGRSRTMVRLRLRDGAELAGPIEVDPDGGACEGLARSRSRWGVVWRHGRTSPVSMRVGILDDTGALRGAPFDLDSPTEGSGRGGVIAADGDGFVAAVAVEGSGVELTRIDAEGMVIGRGLVAAPRARYGAIAVHGDGTLGLLVRDGAREVGGLRFLHVDRDLSTTLAQTRLVTDGRGVRHPRIVPLPDGWAALWVEQGDSSMPATAAVLAHLGHDGLPIEPRRVLIEGENSGYGGPALAFHDGALFTAIARPPSSPGGHEQVEVTRLTCEAPARPRCAPNDARSDGTRCSLSAGFTWTGSRCEEIACGCAGTECDRVGRTEEECLADHAGCAR
jgi:hypothetical protein